jgi:hypothetical protein
MDTLSKKIILFLFCSGIIALSQVNATLYEDLTFEEMVDRADLIVIGQNNGEVNVRYEKVEDPELEDFEFGYTEWEIVVTSYLKGATQGETILLSTPGPSKGANNNETVYITRSTEYRLDELIEEMEYGLVNKVEDILFFLEEKDGHYDLITPKAVVPLNIVYWEDHINRDVVNEEDMDPEVVEESKYLQAFIEETPHYSPDGKLQNGNHSYWYLYILGVIAIGIVFLIMKKRIEVTHDKQL